MHDIVQRRVYSTEWNVYVPPRSRSEVVGLDGRWIICRTPNLYVAKLHHQSSSVQMSSPDVRVPPVFVSALTSLCLLYAMTNPGMCAFVEVSSFVPVLHGMKTKLPQMLITFPHYLNTTQHWSALLFLINIFAVAHSLYMHFISKRESWLMSIRIHICETYRLCIMFIQTNNQTFIMINYAPNSSETAGCTWSVGILYCKLNIKNWVLKYKTKKVFMIKTFADNVLNLLERCS